MYLEFKSLKDSYDWLEKVNKIKGYPTPGTKRYTPPLIHNDSTCDRDDDLMPIAGSIVGKEKGAICQVNDKCPEETLNEELRRTKEELTAKGWFAPLLKGQGE